MSRKRKKLVNHKQFMTAKRLRAIALGKICEVCRRAPGTVGHHVYGLSQSGVLEIQLRCARCEIICHKEVAGGNPLWAMTTFAQNNNTIACLVKTPAYA